MGIDGRTKNRTYDYDKVAEYIGDYYKTHYKPPSFREISNALDIPMGATITHILNVLVDEGKLIKLEQNEPRRFVPTWVKKLIDIKKEYDKYDEDYFDEEYIYDW